MAIHKKAWFWFVRDGKKSDGTDRHSLVNPTLLTLATISRNFFRKEEDRAYWVGSMEKDSDCAICKIVYRDGSPSYCIEDAPKLPEAVHGVAAALHDLVFSGRQTGFPYFMTTARRPGGLYETLHSAARARGGRLGVLAEFVDGGLRHVMSAYPEQRKAECHGR